VGKVSLPPNARFEDCSLATDEELLPFHDYVINLGVTPMEAGVYNVKPKIVYEDEYGKKRITSLEPVEIVIENLNTSVPSKSKIEFKSQAAENIFGYLIKSFNEDCLRKIPEERSGWRTLMDIVKNSKVSKHAVYDSARKRGHAILELESRRLIEAKIFSGERGRGGSVLKIRIANRKENE
jgi:hypothetical protein